MPDLGAHIKDLEKLACEASELLMCLAQNNSQQSPEMFDLAVRCSRMIRMTTAMQQRLGELMESQLGTVQEHRAELDKLKKQQDADYFLSAQLAKPFAVDMLVCDTVEAETLTRQKRQFQFGARS